MDIISAVSYLGDFINKNTEEKEKKVSNKVKNYNTTGKNIFHSNEKQQHEEALLNMAKKRTKDSENTEETGVVPDFYNVETLDNREDINSGFYEMFEEIKYDNYDQPQPDNFDTKYISHINDERDMKNGISLFDKNNTDMTYGVGSDMSHNNMVPFISKPGYGYGNTSNIEEQKNEYNNRKLELFTGEVNNVDYKHKQEQKPLFNPIVGYTNVFGLENIVDKIDSRYVPSLEKRNEKPFQPHRITPGLNLGKNEVSKGGFHEYHRTFRPNVDELRTKNNPKLSYNMPIKTGMKSERRPTVAAPKRRRPVTFWELDHPITGMGETRAPTVHGKYLLQNTAREETARPLVGNPGHEPTQHLAYENYPRINPAQKISYRHADPHNATRVEASKARDNMDYEAKQTLRAATNTNYVGNVARQELDKGHAFDMTSNIPQANMRSFTQDNTNIANAGISEHNKGHNYDMQSNIPQPTLRNTTEHFTQISNAANSEHNRGHAFDWYTNVPQVTMRQFTEDNTNIMNTGMAEHNKGHAFDMMSNVPQTTIRNLTENNTNILNAGNTEHNKSHAFDMFTNIPQTTMRQFTEDNTNIMNTGMSEHNKGHAFDMMSNIPQPTTRNLTENNTNILNAGTDRQRTGHAFDMMTNMPQTTMREFTEKNTNIMNTGIGEHRKGHAYDMLSNKPQTTIRNLTEDNTNILNAGTNQYRKGHAFDMDSNKPQHTIRNLTEDNTNIMNVGTNQYRRGHAFDADTNRPEFTRRDIHSKTERSGHIGNSEVFKSYSKDEKGLRPELTMRDIHVRTDRSGNVGNNEGNKTYAKDKVGWIPDQTMRSMHHKTPSVGPMLRFEKQASRHDYANAITNVNNECILRERKPTDCNYEKGPTYETTVVELCDPIQFNREMYPDITQRNDRINPTMYTKPANTLPNDELRFNSFANENIKHNPYNIYNHLFPYNEPTEEK